MQLWVAFQLLHAVAQAHERGVCHGDIKCENVLVTSWNWVFLTDFASYKPAALPADNPVTHKPWGCCSIVAACVACSLFGTDAADKLLAITC